MINSYNPLRFLALGTCFSAISACSSDPALMDWVPLPDGRGTFSASETLPTTMTARPTPDGNGVISYPGYEVVVARQGDTVATIASRLGISLAEFASYNAVTAEGPLNSGEVFALPRRVSASQAVVLPQATASTLGEQIRSGTINVTSPASGAISNAQVAGTGNVKEASGIQPIRHRVERGETTYTIARLYNISTKTIADWNGLGFDLGVREGQYLLVPVTLNQTVLVETVTAPGQGSPTPRPPSSTKPLPDEEITPAARPAPGTPPSPNLKKGRSTASEAQFAMPADGKIIRSYNARKNPGIDIGAEPGSLVKAAADGTVAAITKDTGNVPVLVVRHANNILTIYANIDGIKVAEGDKLKRGQSIAVVRAVRSAFLHFEVRNGVDAVDPMPYLQ